MLDVGGPARFEGGLPSERRSVLLPLHGLLWLDPQKWGNRMPRSTPSYNAAPITPDGLPIATSAEMAGLRKLLNSTRHLFDALASRYALQFNLGDVRRRISAETVATLKPLRAAEIKKLSMLLAARAIVEAGEGSSPEEISEAFCRDGLTRYVLTGNKPLVDVKTVVHIVVNWVDSRGLAIGILRRLALARSGDRVDSSPHFDPDDPEAIILLEKALRARWACQVAAVWPNGDQGTGSDHRYDAMSDELTERCDPSLAPEEPPKGSQLQNDFSAAYDAAPVIRDSFTETLDLFSKAPLTQNLIKLAWNHAHRKVGLDEVLKRIYKAVHPTRKQRATARTLITRARAELDRRKAPLRFHWNGSDSTLKILPSSDFLPET